MTVALIRLLGERLGLREGTNELQFVTLDVTDNAARHLLFGEPAQTGAEWTSGAVEDKAQEYGRSQATLVLSDAPGRIDDHTRKLLALADALFILARDERDMTSWEALARELDLRVVGRALSAPESTREPSSWDPASRLGVLRGLIREAVQVPDPLSLPADTQDALIQIARFLWEIATEQKTA